MYVQWKAELVSPFVKLIEQVTGAAKVAPCYPLYGQVLAVLAVSPTVSWFLPPEAALLPLLLSLPLFSSITYVDVESFSWLAM